METVKMSFGEKGSLLFAVLNVLQLVGWTAIMIYDGALAADGLLHSGIWIWAIVIGILIIVWIFIGLTNLGKLNTVAMTALFVLSLVLFKVIFFNTDFVMPIAVSDDMMTFGAAVELAVAMPLSWLPLISDYTREAEKPFAATFTSVFVYSVVSSFMYMIGMGAASFYRRIRYRADYVKDRSWRCGITDHCILNRYNNVLRCLFRRSFLCFHFF